MLARIFVALGEVKDIPCIRRVGLQCFFEKVCVIFTTLFRLRRPCRVRRQCHRCKNIALNPVRYLKIFVRDAFVLPAELGRKNVRTIIFDIPELNLGSVNDVGIQILRQFTGDSFVRIEQEDKIFTAGQSGEPNRFRPSRSPVDPREVVYLAVEVAEFFLNDRLRLVSTPCVND